MKSSFSNIHIVLIEPEIPGNTGNVGRTCIGLGARLHLVGKLGFSLDEKHLKRAGLDYWPKIDLKLHSSWNSFLEQLETHADLSFFSTHGKTTYWDKAYVSPSYLIFGSESRGFPKPFYEIYKEKLLRIPVTGDIRSLNLATAVGTAAFEVARQLR